VRGCGGACRVGRGEEYGAYRLRGVCAEGAHAPVVRLLLGGRLSKVQAARGTGKAVPKSRAAKAAEGFAMVLVTWCTSRGLPFRALVFLDCCNTLVTRTLHGSFTSKINSGPY